MTALQRLHILGQQSLPATYNRIMLSEEEKDHMIDDFSVLVGQMKVLFSDLAGKLVGTKLGH